MLSNKYIKIRLLKSRVLHQCYWGGFSKPSFLVKFRTNVEMSETIFFLPFLAALKMALAGAFSKEPRLKTRGWREVYLEEPQSL
jgi:hypothetical protein